MDTTMVPDQVKTQKIQAGVQVSRHEDSKVIFSTGSTLEGFILFVFVLDRNIVSEVDNDLHQFLCISTCVNEQTYGYFKWDKGLRQVILLGKATYEWNDIIGELLNMHYKNNIKSVLSKVGTAACVYVISRERNLRIFQDEKRNEDVLIKTVKEEIKWKLASLTLKKSKTISMIFKELGIIPNYASIKCQ
ncbi:hypothetical protein Tco_1346016 [Tanacetum coccineum]